MKDSEHPIHDRGKYHIGESNVQKRVFQQFGDLDGMKKAPFIHESDWETAGLHHGFTEPHAVVAHWDPAGRLTVWTPQQVPHYLHRGLSAVLDIPDASNQCSSHICRRGFWWKIRPISS